MKKQIDEEAEKAKKMEKIDAALDSENLKNADTAEIAKELGEKNKLEALRRKEEAQKLFDKIHKYKGDNLKVIDDFKNEYLAPIKEFSPNEAQCDIITGDPRTLVLEKIETKKKKPRAVSL